MEKQPKADSSATERIRSTTLNATDDEHTKNPEATKVATTLESFMSLPMHLMAKSYGKVIKSFVHELTGLSHARISKGQLDSLGASSFQKIEAHQASLLKERVAKDTDALDAFNRMIESAPKTHFGSNAVWAVWLHVLEHEHGFSLTRSKQVALTIDELLEDLIGACRRNELQAFRDNLLGHYQRHGQLIRLNTDQPANEIPDAERRSLADLDTWQQAMRAANDLIERVYIDLLSALDVEWGNQYFKRLAPSAPLAFFPLVMPSVHADVLTSGTQKPKKNWLYRPSRRLLQFLHAIAYRQGRQHWPTQPALPKALSQKLVEVTPADISNHFDGTRNLTQKTVDDYWCQLFKNLSRGKVDNNSIPQMPLPMVMLALQWQDLLITDGGKSIFLFDLERYAISWRHRYHSWIGHPSSDAIKWPDWLINQSVSLS